MIETLSNVMTAFGLSASAGLNAYLPLLVVALTARFTNLIQLQEPWNVLTSWWVIGALVGLLVIEMTVDKIPAVDTVNDIVQTVGRPAAGAVLFAANSGVIGDVHPAVALIAGLLVAGGVHAAKTTVRPVITASTGGTGNWLVSTLEDVLAFLASVLAILVPVIIFLAVIFFFLVFFWWRSRRRREGVAAI